MPAAVAPIDLIGGEFSRGAHVFKTKSGRELPLLIDAIPMSSGGIFRFVDMQIHGMHFVDEFVHAVCSAQRYARTYLFILSRKRRARLARRLRNSLPLRRKLTDRFAIPGRHAICNAAHRYASRAARPLDSAISTVMLCD